MQRRFIAHYLATLRPTLILYEFKQDEFHRGRRKLPFDKAAKFLEYAVARVCWGMCSLFAENCMKISGGSRIFLRGGGGEGVEWGANCQSGCANLLFCNSFCPKLHENERTWTEKRRTSSVPPWDVVFCILAQLSLCNGKSTGMRFHETWSFIQSIYYMILNNIRVVTSMTFHKTVWMTYIKIWGQKLRDFSQKIVVNDIHKISNFMKDIMNDNCKWCHSQISTLLGYCERQLRHESTAFLLFEPAKWYFFSFIGHEFSGLRF